MRRKLPVKEGRVISRTLMLAAVVVMFAGGAPHAATEFAGSTPCGNLARRFLQIGNFACEQITWELVLRNDPGHPRRFDLRVLYRLPVPGAPGHLDAGTPLRLRGTWTSGSGSSAHRGRTIYTLTIDDRTLRFALLENNLLHLLAADSRLMVGNAGWSYTLNRHSAFAAGDARRMEAIDSIPADMAGDFEGRTPCLAVAAQLKLAQPPDCAKLKWGLTLFQDAATGRPTIYTLEGTLYRAAARSGTWGMLRDPLSGSLIYRLDPDQPAGYLSLMRADDHILFLLDDKGNALVGDRSYSYTLNRAKRRD